MILVYWKWKVGQGIQKLLKHLQIPFEIKDDNDKITDFNKYSYIVPSPWIKPSHKIYQYKDKIIWELDLIHWILTQKLNFKEKSWYYTDGGNNLYFIWITWTDGKSTATWKIYNILKKTKPNNTQIYIGGNFDIPLSELLLEYLQKGKAQNNIFVLEVSSFMAYNLKKLKFLASIWTNFAPDHLDWHKDLQEYFQSKQKLLKNSALYFPKFVLWRKKPKFFKTKKLTYFTKNLIQKLGWKVPWNLAYMLSKIPPLPHRFNYIWKIWNTTIVDDGKCTSLNCLLFALEKLDGKAILIAWWFDKGISYHWLASNLKPKIIYWILFGQIQNKLAQEFKKADIPYKKFNNFEEAINFAIKKTNQLKPDYLLFSPAASSFDMFSNRKERVEKFLEIVDGKLKKISQKLGIRSQKIGDNGRWWQTDDIRW